MPRNSSHLVEAQSNTIRRLMEENNPDPVIIKLLNISPDTYYWYKRRIQRQDSKIWEKVHIDSAKYRAVQLIQSLEECFYINRAIAMDENNDPRIRIESSKTMCEAMANIYKLVDQGPTFKPSLS